MHAHLFDLYIPEVSVPPWQPLLTMVGPSILPLGGCAHFPQCQAAWTGHVSATQRQCLCPECGQLMAVWQRAVPGLRWGLSGQSQCRALPCAPSWRPHWTWLSGAASARLSGSCSGRSWSGTRRRWHPSASAQNAAAVDRTTRRTGHSKSCWELRPFPASALGDGVCGTWPHCGWDRFE